MYIYLSHRFGTAVVIIQPYHEMYLNQALVFGIHPIVVSLYDCSNDPSIHSTRASDLWKLNFDEIEKAIDDSEIPVKGLILNSPHNPTGKVFSYDVRYSAVSYYRRNSFLLHKWDLYQTMHT